MRRHAQDNTGILGAINCRVKKCNTNDCNKRGLEEDWNNKLQEQKMQYKCLQHMRIEKITSMVAELYNN